MAARDCRDIHAVEQLFKRAIPGKEKIHWDPIGPAPVENVAMFGAGDLTSSGRALALAIHPTDPELLLLGAAQGGIWRSTNGVLPRPLATPEFSRIEMTLSQGGDAIIGDYHTAVLYAGYAAVLKLDANGRGVYKSDRHLQAALGLLFKSSDGGNGTYWDAWDWSEGDSTVAVFDPAESEHVYVGWQFALARTDQGGSNKASDWKTLFDSSGRNLPNRWVTRIEASYHNPFGATITFSGYDAASGDLANGGNCNVGRVFVTRNLGMTWRNLSGIIGGNNHNQG